MDENNINKPEEVTNSISDANDKNINEDTAVAPSVFDKDAKEEKKLSQVIYLQIQAKLKCAMV